MLNDVGLSGKRKREEGENSLGRPRPPLFAPVTISLESCGVVVAKPETTIKPTRPSLFASPTISLNVFNLTAEAKIGASEANLSVRAVAADARPASGVAPSGLREIAIDVETTGLDPAEGHRICEIACLELIDGKLTGRKLTKLINPDRPIPERMNAVHKITDADVRGADTFDKAAKEFLNFIGDSPLVAHKAEFEAKFLNAELIGCGRPPIAPERWICTMALGCEDMGWRTRISLTNLALKHEVLAESKSGVVYFPDKLQGPEPDTYEHPAAYNAHRAEPDARLLGMVYERMPNSRMNRPETAARPLDIEGPVHSASSPHSRRRTFIR